MTSFASRELRLAAVSGKDDELEYPISAKLWSGRFCSQCEVEVRCLAQRAWAAAKLRAGRYGYFTLNGLRGAVLE